MSTANVKSSPQAHRRRPVAQYDGHGRKVAEHGSMKAAAEVTGLSVGNIAAATNGRCRSVGGFFWRASDGHAPESIEVPARRSRRGRAVVQYDLGGNKLAEYQTTGIAKRVTGVESSTIIRAANAHGRAGGYMWLWENDPRHLFPEYRRSRDVRIRNRLAERYYSVVFAVAQRMGRKLPDTVQRDDLVSAGTFGLLDAIDKFDPARGLKFQTYSNARIQGAILDWLRKQDWVPRVVRERTRKRNRAVEQVRVETGEPPDRAQLMQRLNAAPEGMERFERERLVEQVSLSRVRCAGDNDRDVREIDTLVDTRAVNPADDPNHTGLRDLLLSQLNLTGALIVRLYYVDGLNNSEISELLITGKPRRPLSESRVSQLHKASLMALRGRYGEQLHELLTGRAA